MSIRNITRIDEPIGQTHNEKKVIRFAESKSKLSCWIEYSDGTKEDCKRNVIENLWHHWVLSEGIREDDENYTIFAYYQANYDITWKYKFRRYRKNDENSLDEISFSGIKMDELEKMISSAICLSEANNVKPPFKLIANPFTIDRKFAIHILDKFKFISNIELDEDSLKDIFYIKEDKL